jgi:hypothetical protein
MREASMLYADLFDSKVIAMFAYDLDAQRLVIHFKSGGVYEYQAVPRTVFDDFRAAPSKGQFFRSAVRDRFTARRLSASEVDELGRGRGPSDAPGNAGIVRVDLAALERAAKTSIFF